GIDPHRLCLEITEHSIMRDPPGVATALQPLRNQGVAIAIDDFGTGYSSLAYLARFQPEFLKIDRSFTAEAVDRHDQRSIIEAVLHLSESLGITSIAEGIETEEQADLLLDLGCTLGQGWFFARPTDIDTAFEQAPR
ncbi:MAG: EAL domain-containing protein, partial [Acidimicrobiales bacterium]